MLIVAPATSAPGPTSTGTGSPVSIDWSTAESPSTTTPSVAIFSPGRTTNRSPARSSSIGTDDLAAVAQHARLLRAELEQRADRRARAPPRARLEVAAEQDQRRDDRGDLEVRVRVVESDDQRDDRPAPGGERPDRDERVHRRREVAARSATAARWKPNPAHRTTGVASAKREPLPARRTGAAGSSRAASAGPSAPSRRRAGCAAPGRDPRVVAASADARAW